MKKYKWWHIVALLIEIVGLGFIVLTMATDLNDELFLFVALACVSGGNMLMLIMNMRQNNKNKRAQSNSPHR